MTRRIGYMFGALAHSLYTRIYNDPGPEFFVEVCLNVIKFVIKRFLTGLL